MSCNHPKAARAIRVLSDGSMVTECWACEVRAEKKRQPTKVGDILAAIVKVRK